MIRLKGESVRGEARLPVRGGKPSQIKGNAAPGLGSRQVAHFSRRQGAYVITMCFITSFFIIRYQHDPKTIVLRVRSGMRMDGVAGRGGASKERTGAPPWARGR